MKLIPSLKEEEGDYSLSKVKNKKEKLKKVLEEEKMTLLDL